MANGANVELCVSGVAIRPEFQGPVYVPTRKVYNASYFHDDRYRHEIANHYRDCKMRPRLRRRKRGHLMSSVVQSIKREMPYEYCPELPMAIQKLPRFDREHSPPAGRQQRHLCDEKRKDLVCNDTLQRIQKATAEDDIEKLKHFARRYLERFHGFEPSRTKWRRRPRSAANVYHQSLEKCEKWHNEVKDLQKPTSNKSKYRRRSLGKLESVDRLTRRHHQQQQQQQQRRRLQPQELRTEHGCGVIGHLPSKRSFVTQPPPDGTTIVDGSKSRERANTSLTYYLQLATDFYEQGFLSNIKYLENVGERNRLRRNQETLRQSTTAEPQRSTTYKCTSFAPSLTCWTESRLTGNASQYEGVDSNDNDSGNSNNICNPILKIIAKKRSFRIYRYNEKEREHPAATYSAHWPIRVQIKPADSSSAAALTETQTNGTVNSNGNSKSSKIPSQAKPEDRNKTTVNKDYCCSMNDYLNGNLQLQQAPNSKYHQLTSFHSNYPAKELLIDALIDNLKELEIEEYPLHLPRITLSDCSSHRFTTEYTITPTSSPTTLDVDTSLLSGKSSLDSILLRRQESVDLSTNNLGLPLVSSHYQSEARPT